MNGSAPAGTHHRPSATGGTRIDALDGVRALGLLLIMGFHFGIGWLPAGFVGVDVFYVLSGYLITGLLLGEWARSARIRLGRVLGPPGPPPAAGAVVVLVVVTLVVRFTYPAGLYPDLRMADLSALFYFSNWWQIASSGSYFVATGPVSPLAHTWTLAVEEQFYLVWPLVALAVLHLGRRLRPGGPNAARRVAGGRRGLGRGHGPAVPPRRQRDPPLLRHRHPRPVDPGRLGAGLHAHPGPAPPWPGRHGPLGSVPPRPGGPHPARTGRPGRHRGADHFPVGHQCLPLPGRLPAVGPVGRRRDHRGGVRGRWPHRPGAVGAADGVDGHRLLRRLPLALPGLHRPRRRAHRADRAVPAGRSVAATFAMAAGSYYLVERPVMEGVFWRSVRAAGPALAAMAATVVVVFAGTAVTATATASVQSLRATVNRSAGVRGSVPVMVYGDSTALTLGMALSGWAQESHDGLDVIDQAIVGCGIAESQYFVADGVVAPVTAACNTDSPVNEQWPAILAGDLNRYHPKFLVFLVGRTELYDRIDANGSPTNINDTAYASYIREQLQRVVTMGAAVGCHVELLTTPYFQSGEQPDGQPRPEDQPERARAYNRIVAEVVAANPHLATLVNLNAMVSPGGKFASSIDGIVIRAPDGIHFPFFDLYHPNVAAPDTLAQVNAFPRWIGPQIDGPLAKVR